jgi:hypothetical protein
MLPRQTVWNVKAIPSIELKLKFSLHVSTIKRIPILTIAMCEGLSFIIGVEVKNKQVT